MLAGTATTLVMMMSIQPAAADQATVDLRLQPPPDDHFDAILRALWKYGEECAERVETVGMPAQAAERLRARVQICYAARVQLRATLPPPVAPSSGGRSSGTPIPVQFIPAKPLTAGGLQRRTENHD
jgi:hypothetical protein